MTDNPDFLTPERRAEIRARVDAASPAPWRTDSDHCGCVHDDNEILFEHGMYHTEGYSERANADFAANARQDVPDLLAYVDALELAIRRALMLGEEDPRGGWLILQSTIPASPYFIDPEDLASATASADKLLAEYSA